MKRAYPFLFALTFAAIGVAPRLSADDLHSQVLEADAGAAPVNLFIATNGVALSRFPSSKRLSASALVGLTGKHAAVSWTSTSDAPWLKATHSGTSGQMIILSANPARLKPDVAHVATVKVSTNDLGATENTATIRVSIWVSATDPGTVTIGQQAVALAANPVEPWVYLSAGDSSVEVFNVYSGLLVTTFSHVAPTVGQLVVSSDGTGLFAVDTTNYKIIKLNAFTGEEIRTFALAGPISSDFSFAYARPAAVETLFAPDQSAFNVASGKKVSTPISNGSGFYDPLIRATPDGTKLVILERSLSPGSLYTYAVLSAGGDLRITERQTASIVGENCQALAISDDGSRLYPACGAPYEFDVYEGNTLQQIQTLPAVPYPDNAVIDSNGDFVGGVSGLYQSDDVFVFDAVGYSLGVVPTTVYSSSEGQGNNLLVSSGDSTRVISATAAVYNPNQTLMFRSLP